MIKALVQIECNPGRANEVGQRIADLSRDAEVYSCSGRFDIVAIINSNTPESITDIVHQKIPSIPGVRVVRTEFLFRSYAAHDLEEGFHLGLGG